MPDTKTIKKSRKHAFTTYVVWNYDILFNEIAKMRSRKPENATLPIWEIEN
jgi:hypothetical protein